MWLYPTTSFLPETTISFLFVIPFPICQLRFLVHVTHELALYSRQHRTTTRAVVPCKGKNTLSFWAGNLSLSFVAKQGKTMLKRQEALLPLAFQRPLYPEGSDVCHGIILHPPGGVAKDDQLHIHVDLAEGTHVVLTSPGATKIYRSTTNAHQNVKTTVSNGACLEWLPQETILFDGAYWHQKSLIELDTKGLWLGWDITRFGRSASGERFLRGCWKSTTEVWRGGRPLWVDRQRLDGGSTLLDSPFGLKGNAVTATLAWVGAPVDRDLIDACRSWWQSRDWEGDAGVTRLECGLTARYRGPSTANARAWFVAIWDMVRRQFLQRPAYLPRVWNN